MIKKMHSSKKGFTLIELMIVIAIIGILAAIAIPNFVAYRERSYNSAANADAKNCYTAAQGFFVDDPAGTATITGIAQLVDYGFTPSPGVTVTISGGADDLAITAVHAKGTKQYAVDAGGVITPSAAP